MAGLQEAVEVAGGGWPVAVGLVFGRGFRGVRTEEGVLAEAGHVVGLEDGERLEGAEGGGDDAGCGRGEVCGEGVDCDGGSGMKLDDGAGWIGGAPGAGLRAAGGRVEFAGVAGIEGAGFAGEDDGAAKKVNR